jgi:hypothetical protein
MRFLVYFALLAMSSAAAQGQAGGEINADDVPFGNKDDAIHIETP